MEIELAIVNAAVSDLLPTGRLTSALSAEAIRALDRRLQAATLPTDITRIKLWTIHGRLAYDNNPATPADGTADTVSRRAQTVVTTGLPLAVHSAGAEDETHFETGFGTQTYELYYPVRNRNGDLVAVAEVYSDKEILADQFQTIIRDTSNVWMLAALAGIVGLLGLVRIAHRRLQAKDDSMRKELAALASRNAQLLQESEVLRRNTGQMSERNLEQIGNDLHDGPVQLLSLTGLYLDKVTPTPDTGAVLEKARGVLGRVLGELRSISEGLVLPELDGKSLDECLSLAVRRFTALTGMPVRHRDFSTGARPEPEVCRILYRILWECLQNAYKHAEGKGVTIETTVTDGWLHLAVSDRGPGFPDARQPGHAPPPDQSPAKPMAGNRQPIGLVGIRTRLRGIGGRMEIVHRDGHGTSVQISAPL